MAIKFEKLKEGMTLYTVSKHKMGNTTINTVSVHTVKIISIDEHERSFVYSWNGNAPEKGREWQLKNFKVKEPVLIRGRMGYARLATREEIKAMKE
jgi:hypothetical protein